MFGLRRKYAMKKWRSDTPNKLQPGGEPNPIPPVVPPEPPVPVDTTSTSSWDPTSGKPPPGFEGDVWNEKMRTTNKKFNPITGKYEDVTTWQGFKKGGVVPGKILKIGGQTGRKLL